MLGSLAAWQSGVRWVARQLSRRVARWPAGPLSLGLMKTIIDSGGERGAEGGGRRAAKGRRGSERTARRLCSSLTGYKLIALQIL